VPTTDERVHAAAARDLADETHVRRSLTAAIERRSLALRRRRAGRGRRSAALAAAGVLALGAGGAVAQQQAGDPAPARASSSSSKAGTVAAVQRALGVPADGVAGPRTRRAVRRFQRQKGLTVDGVIGPQTLAALGISSARASGRPAPAGKAPSAQLRKIAACESGGDPTAVSPSGQYRGKYQFSRATWRAMGGKGDPAAAPEAVQDRLAAKLLATQGPGAWPNCA
jgi:hypothetical protein